MATNKWVIDPAHSEVLFKVKHMMISTVHGRFDEFEGTAETEGDDFKNAKIDVKINAGSISTNNKDRDTHLRSEDFFKSETYPEIRFSAKSFDGEKLKGDLTIRDVTRPVELDVDFNGIAVDPYGQTKAGFEAEGTVNRKDFGLNWSAVTEAGNIVVSDKVKMIIDAQFVKQG
jgi:polyisoprenoid-binding protein YceI